MSLPTQKFIDSFKEILMIDTQKFNLINDLLIRTGSIIAGGAVLSAYNNYSAVTSSDILPRTECDWNYDFDIYVHLNHAEELVNGLKENLNNLELAHNCNYIAPAYDESFFKKNNILGRFMFVVKDLIYLDILIVSNDKPLTDVVDSFDLTFCKIWYDGISVNARDPTGIINKTGSLEQDYVKTLLNGNFFTSKRIEKYKNKGYKISINLEESFVLEKKKKTIVSAEDWVVSKIFKYLVFDTDQVLMNLFAYIDVFRLDSFETFIAFNLNSYVLSELTNSLRHLGITNEDIQKLYALAFYDKLFPEEYRDYINSILDIGDINEIGALMFERYRYEFSGDEFSGDEFSGDIEVMNEEDDDADELSEFNFEDIDINERDVNFDRTCKDLILNDDVDIVAHLNETDTFLFINGNPTDEDNILCFEKSYIRAFYEDKNNNWFYECTGPFIRDRNGILTNDRSMSSFGNTTYIKIPIDSSGLTGFIPKVQIKKILLSSYKVYYINPMLENGIQKMITHSVSWQNSYGPRNRINFVSANHCQSGSSILIYTLKVCNDPERCVRSIIQ